MSSKVADFIIGIILGFASPILAIFSSFAFYSILSPIDLIYSRPTPFQLASLGILTDLLVLFIGTLFMKLKNRHYLIFVTGVIIGFILSVVFLVFLLLLCYAVFFNN